MITNVTLPASTRKKDGGRIGGPANVPNVMEIRQVFSLPNGKTIGNVFHGSYSGTPPNSQTVASALWSSMSSAWSTNLAPHMHANTSMLRVEVRDMASHLNPIAIGTGAAVAGTGTAPAMPAENAIVLTENITGRGKGLKGRAYLGGWDTSADLGSGVIAPAVVTAVDAYGTAVFNAINAQSLSPCVAQVARQQYSGLTGTVIPARAANHVAVSTYTCRDNAWDSQRRRGA